MKKGLSPKDSPFSVGAPRGAQLATNHEPLATNYKIIDFFLYLCYDRERTNT